MDMIFCKKCNQLKSRDDYLKNKNSRTGLGKMCKQCFSAYQRNRYRSKPEVREKAKLASKEQRKQESYREWERKYLKEYQKSYRRYNVNESEIIDMFCEQLSSLNVSYDRELRTGYGEIDVILYSPYISIIEFKRSTISTDIQRALGQLLIYKWHSPMAKLYAWFPYDLSDDYKQIFTLYGIKIWDWEEYERELQESRKSLVSD